MKKWSVRKLDGAWMVFDHRGVLRYASNEWLMAISFALLCGSPLPKPPSLLQVQADYFRDVLRRLWFGEDQ